MTKKYIYTLRVWGNTYDHISRGTRAGEISDNFDDVFGDKDGDEKEFRLDFDEVVVEWLIFFMSSGASKTRFYDISNTKRVYIPKYSKVHALQ